MSGGLDSIVLAADLIAKGKKIVALHLQTGRNPMQQELHTVKKFCFENGVFLEIVDLSGLQTMMRGFMTVEEATTLEYDIGCPDEVAIKCLTSIALYYGQLTHIPEIFLGLLKEPLHAKRDIKGFLPMMSDAINAFEQWPTKVRLNAPFLKLDKQDVIKLGASLSVEMEHTWSCCNGGKLQCGQCYACTNRKTAFVAAGLTDKTAYLK
jgi:7-cyano-7-deazaguanine synthase